MSDIIVINVGGRKFEVERDTFLRFPETKLGQLAATDKKKTVTYQRLTSVFKCVLVYYETGHLHMPLTVCPGLVQDDLEFWGFKIDDLDPCCRRKLKKFHREQEDFISFEKSISEDISMDSNCCYLPESCFTKGRRYLWRILDKPLSSIFAKIYFLISSLIIILSILVVFLDTMKDFKKEMTDEDWEEYMGSSYHDHKDKIDLLSGDDHLLDQSNDTWEDIVGNFTLPVDVFVRDPTFASIQLYCTIFFIVELVLKLLVYPNILQFFKSFLNLIDVLAVIVSLVDLIAEYVSPEEKYTNSYVDAIGALQVIRVLRLLRLTKNITGARVLAFAVSNSYKELGFMALLIAINTIVFGTLAHSVNKDKMLNLPLASWWALITMTTVGYGDIVPNNHLGKCVGVLCACMGIMILALTMPLFVDNFLTFYSYGQEVFKEKVLEKSPQGIKVTPVKNLEKDIK